MTYFIKRESLEMGIPLKQIQSDALHYLINYRWGGNIRELENFVKYILSTVDGEQIGVKNIPDHFKEKAPSRPPASERLLPEDLTGPSIQSPRDQSPALLQSSLAGYTWEELEKEYIIQLLSQNNWIVTRAAHDAGLKRSTFDSRMRKLGIKKQG